MKDLRALSCRIYIYILTKQRLCNSGSAFLYSCNPYRCSRAVSKVGKPWSARWVSMSIYEYRMRLRFQRCLFVLIESTWRCGYYERLSSPRRTPARHITRGRQARQSVDAFRPWRKSALSTPGSDDQAIRRNQPRSSKIHVAQFATSEIVPFKTWFAGTAVQAQKLFRTMFASICLSFQDHFQHRDWHKGRQWNLGIRWHQMTSLGSSGGWHYLKWTANGIWSCRAIILNTWVWWVCRLNQEAKSTGRDACGYGLAE